MTNRKTIRAALAALLTGTLTKAQAVYAYQVGDFGGQSPVVFITSSGSLRPRMTAQGGNSEFYLNIHTLVLYAAATGWTEANAEDTLDDLEQEIAGVLDMNQRTANWQALDYDERSNADAPAEIGGVEYLHEIIPVVVEVFG